MFEEYQVNFVHPCSEEGSENIRFIVNVTSPSLLALKDITSRSFVPNLPLTIKIFSTALCGASNVFLSF